MSRFTNSLPDPAITEAVPKIRSRVSKRVPALATERDFFDRVVDGPLRRVFALSLATISASEGTIWVLDEEGGDLVPRHNTGPDAEAFIGRYRQPLDRGIISTVIVTQRGVSESYVYRNAGHDPSVNKLLGNITAHMIVLPWFIAGDPAGIVSAVKLRKADEDDPPPYDAASFDVMSDFTTLLGEISAARLLEAVIENR